MYDLPAILGEPKLKDSLRQSVEEGARPAFLRSVKIKLTARCNLRCEMCKYGRGLSLPELPGERFQNLMAELAQLGCRKVHFSGGEVLARRDFESIAGAAAEAKLKVALTSNLTLMSKERAKALMRYKINSISTSLDGVKASTHEAIRGVPGAFRRTLRGISFLSRERARRGRRTRLRVNTVLMRRNFREYPDLIRLASRLGVTEVHPMPVDSSDKDIRLSKRLIRIYNQEVAPLVAEARHEAGYSTETSYIYPFGRSGLELAESADGQYAGGYYQQNLCFAPYLHMFIAWDGNVFLCCMTNGRIEPLGNIGTQSAQEIFSGPRFQAMRLAMKKARLPSCHACDMYIQENQRIAQAFAS